MLLEDETSARAWLRENWGDERLGLLERFAAKLVSEVSTQNLISSSTITSLWRRHIADSAQLLLHVPRETSQWLDLGTGAGFPGIVAAILHPDISITLIENRRLRITWLERVIAELRLSNCRIVGMGVERIPPQTADVISARAFARLYKTLALASRFSTEQTLWLLPKGRNAGQELQSLPARQREIFRMAPSITDRDAKVLVGRGRVILPS